jgi:predicted helicase
VYFIPPDPVVSFIVRSVDYLLRTEFDCPDGLADTSTIPIRYKNSKPKGNVVEDVKQVPKVQILDPATGTGTFLKYVIEEIKKTFDSKHTDLSDNELRKEWNEYVDKHLLPRVFGFELLMAPYAIAHLKLGLKLKETGYEFLSRQRLGVALTNALESGTASAGTLEPYLGWLAQESIYANYVKTAKNVSVVIGNPPYAGHSANKSKWIAELLRGQASEDKYKRNYFEVDGEQLGEKNPKWLNDDYVKFIRFGQWRIDKNGQGILAFITNHAYLNNPTFRAMRKSLLDSFDKMYILNLHGNSKIKEKSPDGTKDENVFDIQQGVSIAIFIKNTDEEKSIQYYDAWGIQDFKYDFLINNSIQSIEWVSISPVSPFWLFIPQDVKLLKEYNRGISLTEIFDLSGIAIQTHRDKLVFDLESRKLEFRISNFIEGSLSDTELKQKFLSAGDKLNIENARNTIKKLEISNNIHLCLSRPFDVRFLFYHKALVDRPREAIMQHILGCENLSLIGMRHYAYDVPEYCYVFISTLLTDSRIFISNKGAASIFPLYLIKNGVKFSNIKAEVIDKFSKGLSCRDPNSILYYLYGILHSKKFRKRYGEFLSMDFPRIPIPSDAELFSKLTKIGAELISLHLMKSDKLDNLITEFKGEGDNVVAAIGKNSYKDGILRINKTQYFEGIPEEVYNFYIGGYQVCQKWLKDRKGRQLTEEEIAHYQKIVVALKETIQIMNEIDKVIEAHGGWPVQDIKL